MKNQLESEIRERVRATGPLGVDEYMALALGDPRWGYYMTSTPIGRAGDFITSPEVSQLFGELLCVWLVDLWQRAGRPAPVQFVELGPGRGTLMADVLRCAKTWPDLQQAVQPHLVETSPALRKLQQETLAEHAVEWHASVAELGDGCTIFVANEFFDALPVRQWVHAAGQWHTRNVGLGRDGELEFQAGEAAELPAPIAARVVDAADGAIAEQSPASEEIIEQVGRHLSRFGGAMLIVDYGYEEYDLRANGHNDTLQSVRNHQRVGVLDAPGQADITAHVNFSALARAAAGAGARATPVVTQGEFLHRLGLGPRAARLAQGQPVAVRRRLEQDCERLAGGGMGRLFRVMALIGEDWPDPSGFDDGDAGAGP